MKEKAIETALKARIETAGLRLPISWPNVDFAAGVRPRVDVDFFGGERTGGALKGGSQILRITGGINFGVIVALNEGTDAAHDIAEQLVDLFPEGLKLAVTGGTITITAPPSIRKGVPSKTEWRVPVVVSYTAHA